MPKSRDVKDIIQPGWKSGGMVADFSEARTADSNLTGSVVGPL